MSDPKTLLAYMPMTFQNVSGKVFKSFIAMTGPEVQEELAKKNIKLKILIHDTFPIDRNRNEAFDLAVSNKYIADYIATFDGDQVFKPDTLLKLVQTLEDNPEVEGVTGIYFTKTFPHRAVAGKYSPWSDSLELKRESLKSQGFIAPDGQQTLYFKHLQYFDVIQPIHAFGMGCAIFRTSIVKKIQQPYFKYVDPYTTGGDYTFGGHTEDMWFCSQLYQAGIKVLVNPKIQVGHIVEKVISGNEAED